MDFAAIAAGWDIVEPLGPDAARQLLQILELSDEARWHVGMTMFQRQETATTRSSGNIEQDTTGQTREWLIVGL